VTLAVILNLRSRRCGGVGSSSFLSFSAFLISGGRDIQVTVANGERLLAAAESAEHAVFENMCHVLKDAETADRVEQLLGVYANSQQPLTEGLVPTIVEFLDRVIIK
jgi:hypothetical protein